MVGELFLGIAGIYLSIAIGTIIYYQIRQRRIDRENDSAVSPE